MNTMKQVLAVSLALVLGIMTGCGKKETNNYKTAQDKIFGTSYSIIYESANDLSEDIKACLNEFDNSLSVFNENSIISKINRNEDVETDPYFETMFAEAQSISELSQGAFDITVAPLVNLWGFGFQNKGEVTQDKIDSLLPITNFLGVTLNTEDHHIYKRDERIMLDASALAKGYACDIVAQRLADNGCVNYLVEIGGEIVAHGLNADGEKWKIGITKPIDDPTGSVNEYEDVIRTSDIKMATSGNYRNYYIEKGGQRRSHTIDPRTGYPVQHKLLSATIVSSSCMRSDALATTCMVMGEDEALEFIENLEDAECYLIIADGDQLKVVTSRGWVQNFEN